MRRTLAEHGRRADVFGGYVNENYQAMQDNLGADDGTLGRIASRSFAASFLDAGRQDALLAEVVAYLVTSGQATRLEC